MLHRQGNVGGCLRRDPKRERADVHLKALATEFLRNVQAYSMAKQQGKEHAAVEEQPVALPPQVTASVEVSNKGMPSYTEPEWAGPPRP